MSDDKKGGSGNDGSKSPSPSKQPSRPVDDQPGKGSQGTRGYGVRPPPTKKK